jgi:hypothetical protein
MNVTMPFVQRYHVRTVEVQHTLPLMLRMISKLLLIIIIIVAPPSGSAVLRR